MNKETHADTLTTFLCNKKLGDSIDFISPIFDEASSLKHKEKDFSIHMQPEMKLNEWETKV